MMRELSEGPSWLFIVPADDNGKVGKIAVPWQLVQGLMRQRRNNLIHSSSHMLIAKKRFLFHVFYTVIM